MEDLNFKKALCLLHFLWLAFSGFCQIDEPPLQEIENYIIDLNKIMDVKVTKEDQGYINEFSRLHQKTKVIKNEKLFSIF